MTTLPSGIGRVPNLLINQLSLANLTRTNLDLLRVQEQLMTQKQVNRPSDDAVKAASISVLNDRLNRSDQRKRNLQHAEAAIGQLDSAMAEVYNIALEGKDIASQMASTLNTAGDRAAQAKIVDQLLNSLLNQANGQSVAGYMFGGSQTGTAPMVEFNGAYRYMGDGNGVTTDLGMFSSVPITLGGSSAIGGVSSRIKGSVDLNPGLSGSTRLADMLGNRGAGVTLGTIEMSINGGARISIDLAGADTAQDIDDKITSAIKAYETANSTTVLAPAGISVSGDHFTVNVAGANTIDFYDPGTGVTAQDLGLAGLTFNSGNANALDAQPKLTWQTSIGQLQGVSGALGQIKINNAGKSAIINLGSAGTLQDVRNLIEGAGLGVRVEINDAGNGIDIFSEVSGGKKQALSIEEVSGQNSTATRLGIRSLAATTAISDFNEGRGVRIVNNVTDPTTGTATYALNKDFTITLGNAAATRISVDLRPQDMASVATIIARINAEAGPQLAAAGLAGTDLVAGLSDGGNGIVLTQSNTFTNPISVAKENNSNAAEDLGFLGGTYNAGSASFTGEDRAKVRVDNLFTRLIDLRDSLNANDTVGITRAAEDLQQVIDKITLTRGEVGGYGKAVDFATTVEEDRATVDKKVRSELQDVDFTEAATRYSLLQTQLNAGMQVTGRISARTLLDFLST